MHIVYLHQYFKLPSEPGGQRSYYFAKGLVQAGHKVTMITSNMNHPDWKFIERRSVDGIDILYVKNSYSSSMTAPLRIWSFLKFMFLSSFLVLSKSRVDLVYATSTPVTIAVPAILLRFFKKIPFIFEVRDMWPDVPREMGFINRPWLFGFLKKYERFIYRYCDHIVAISDGIADLIGLRTKTSVLPFGSNVDLFKQVKTAEKEKFTVLFTGAIGHANSPEYLLQVAKLAQERGLDNINFVMVGNGSAKDKIFNLKNELCLNNFTMENAVPVEELQTYFEQADVGVILFGNRSQTYRYTASPNKFFDYLSAGLPIVFNFEGPLKEKCLEENIGFYVDCNNPESMFNLLQRITENEIDLDSMGARCRALAEGEYNRNEIVNQFTRLIESFN